jgi:hypothetical protein
MSTDLLPDLAQISMHLEWLAAPARGRYDDALIEIAWDDAPTGDFRPTHARLFGLDELPEAAAFAAEQNVTCRNVYAGATLKRPDTPRDRRTKAEDFYVGTAVPFDLDQGLGAARERIRGVGKLALSVDTGTTPEPRMHGWYRLTEPCDYRAAYEDATKAVAGYVGSDLGATGAGRLMRLGGTVNWPSQDKQARGYVAELTTVTLYAPHVVAIERLLSLSPQEVRESPSDAKGMDDTSRWPNAAPGPPLGLPGTRYGMAALEDEAATVAATLEGARDDTLNKAAFNLGQLVGSGDLKREMVEAELTSAAFASGLGPAETRATIRSGLDSGVKKPRTARGANPVDAAAGPDASPPCDLWQQFPTPAFPLDTLPPVVREFVELQALSMGADPSALAMAVLAAAGGAIDHRTKIKMQRTGDWEEPPNIWVALVGNSATMKSPIIRCATAPLRAMNDKFAKDHAKDVANWAAAKKSDKTDDEPPPPLQLITNDATIEAVREVLSKQDRGILQVADELSGWLATMEKYNGASDRGGWLELHHGGPRTSNRANRGAIHSSNFSASVIGGIQPGGLLGLRGLRPDGLLQRFEPVMMRPAGRPQEVEGVDAAREAYHRLLSDLVGSSPCALTMDDEALGIAVAFQGYVHDLIREEGLGESFLSFLGKQQGQQARLMLILHKLADPRRDERSRVSPRTAGDAARILREFVIPHAFALYQDSADGADWEELRAVGSYVLTSDKDRFTPSDFTAGVHPLRGLGTWQIEQRLSAFVALGWLVEEEVRGGRVKAWKPVPGLRAYFAKRAAAEAERKARVATILRSLTRGAPREP